MCRTRKYREGAPEEMIRIEREVTKSTVHLRRAQALDVMRDFRNHKITTKAAATKLLHIRRWVSVQSDPDHPYSTLSNRLHRLAILLMGGAVGERILQSLNVPSRLKGIETFIFTLFCKCKNRGNV